MQIPCSLVIDDFRVQPMIWAVDSQVWTYHGHDLHEECRRRAARKMPMESISSLVSMLGQEDYNGFTGLPVEESLRRCPRHV